MKKIVIQSGKMRQELWCRKKIHKRMKKQMEMMQEKEGLKIRINYLSLGIKIIKLKIKKDNSLNNNNKSMVLRIIATLILWCNSNKQRIT